MTPINPSSPSSLDGLQRESARLRPTPSHAGAISRSAKWRTVLTKLLLLIVELEFQVVSSKMYCE